MNDLINRDDVLRLAESGKLLSGSFGERAKDIISSIPSAEPKVGRWIDSPTAKNIGLVDLQGNEMEIDIKMCSECRYEGWETNYCPNCGAKMEGNE